MHFFFQILYSAAYYRANNVLPKVTPIFTFIVAFMAYGRTGIALSLIFVVVTYAVSFWRSKVLYKFIFLLLTLILSVVAFRYFAVMENFILVETNFNSGFETPCTKMVKDYIASLDFFRIFTGSDLSAIPIIFQHDNNPHNSIIYGHSQYGIFYVLLLFSLMVIVIKNKPFRRGKVVYLLFLSIFFIRILVDKISLPGIFDFIFYYIIYIIYFDGKESNKRAIKYAQEQ